MAISANQAKFYDDLHKRVTNNLVKPYSKRIADWCVAHGIEATEDKIHRVVRGMRKDIHVLIGICEVYKVDYTDLIPAEELEIIQRQIDTTVNAA